MPGSGRRQDFGQRPRQETQLLELFPSLEGCTTPAPPQGLDAPPAPAGGPVVPTRAGRGTAPALGCVGIVVPWNYPIYLTIGPSPPPADSHFFNHLFCEDFCSSL